MVHHTVRKLYGDNCFYADNSWKRYQRHLGGDTLIFNFGNSCCNSYSLGCCGGGSFWGGFGTGIGYGIANLFGGFMNSFVSMPFMNMFGGGMFGNMFSCNLWNTSPWSTFGDYTTPDKTDDKKDKNTKTNSEVKPLAADKPAETAAAAPAASAASPANSSTQVQQTKDQLENRLKSAKSDELQSIYNDAINAQKAAPDDQKSDYNAIINNVIRKASENNIVLKTADGSEVNPAPTGYDVEGLTNADKIDLNAMGVRVVDLPSTDCPKGLGLPSTMTTVNLQKLQAISDRTGIPVAVANNEQATEDKWIAGKISDIENVSNKISFKIDCGGVGEYGYKYQATQKEANVYNIKCITPNIARKTSEDGKDYDLTSGTLKKDGEALVSN